MQPGPGHADGLFEERLQGDMVLHERVADHGHRGVVPRTLARQSMAEKGRAKVSKVMQDETEQERARRIGTADTCTCRAKRGKAG